MKYKHLTWEQRYEIEAYLTSRIEKILQQKNSMFHQIEKAKQFKKETYNAQKVQELTMNAKMLQ